MDMLKNQYQEAPGDSKMILRTSDLVKRYRKRTVVNHVSVELEQGEIVGLLGPNGAGKTTSFYMIVGLITPNEGSIYLNDVDITREPVYKRAQRGIGYLAQEASVFRQLSVEDNITAVLEMSDIPKAGQKERVEFFLRSLASAYSERAWGSSYPGVKGAEPKLPGPWHLSPTLYC
jgi:lipopolysaccharide export system ATP-binding protein